MDVDTDTLESLRAELTRLRQQNAELTAGANPRFGLAWERDALGGERDLDKAHLPDLLLEENGQPISMLEDNPGNLIMEGNNVNALKMLSLTQSGKFDCIFLDPPYGTGNQSWVYNDEFVNPDHHFKDSGWLSWMEPRLELARDLLSPKGCILLCIDDAKRATADLLMEQVMPGKRVGSIVWRTRQGANDKGLKNLSVNHEHVLVYGNADFEFGGNAKTYAMYKNFDEGSVDPYRVADMTINIAWDEKRAGKGYYPIHDPKTDTWYPCNPNAVWRFGSEQFLKPGRKNRKDTMEILIAKGRVIFPRNKPTKIWETRAELDAAIASGEVPVNGKRLPLLRSDLPDLDFFIGKRVGWGIPQYKRYKSELDQARQPFSSWVRSTLDKEKAKAEEDGLTVALCGTTREGASHLASLMGRKTFNYPKPLSFMVELLRQATSADSLVLDCFAGSGTTGEAVLRLNLEDQGERKFVLVSNTESTSKKPKVNLCRDVCAARIRKVIERSRSGKDKSAEAIASGFAYLRLTEYDGMDRAREFTPERLWTLVLLRHGCAIRPWNPQDDLDCESSADDHWVALMPKPTAKGIAALNARRSNGGLTLYTSYPSRLRPLLLDANIEVIDTSALEPGVSVR